MTHDEEMRYLYKKIMRDRCDLAAAAIRLSPENMNTPSVALNLFHFHTDMVRFKTLADFNKTSWDQISKLVEAGK